MIVPSIVAALALTSGLAAAAAGMLELRLEAPPALCQPCRSCAGRCFCCRCVSIFSDTDDAQTSTKMRLCTVCAQNTVQEPITHESHGRPAVLAAMPALAARLHSLCVMFRHTSLDSSSLGVTVHRLSFVAVEAWLCKLSPTSFSRYARFI